MKKYLFGLLAMFAASEVAVGQKVSVADVEAVPGETVAFSVDLSEGKADTYTAITLYVQFPTNGFTTTGEYTVSSSWKDVSCVVGDVDSDGMAVIPIASANAIPESNVAGLITVNFKVDENVTLGEYKVTLKRTRFEYGYSDKDYADDATFKVNVVRSHAVVLDENSTTIPKNAKNVNAHVLRTLTADEWTTICLPFAMTEAQVKAAFGDGVQVAAFTSWNSEEDSEGGIVHLNLCFESFTAMEANTPYIINVAQDVTEFTLDGVDIAPEEEPTVQVGTKKAERGYLTGTYVVASVPKENLVLDGGQFAYSDGTMQTKAFSAYFELADVLTDMDSAADSIDIVIDGKNIPTSIANSVSDASPNGGFYNLNGQRLHSPKRGLVISNGKKAVLIR